MTTVNTIPSATGAQTGSTQGAGGKAGGLEGLMALLTKISDAASASPAAQGLSAKITALLKNPPADKGQLALDLQNLLGQSSQTGSSSIGSLIQQLMAQVQNPATPPGNLGTSLFSDLTASSASAIQGATGGASVPALDPSILKSLREQASAASADGESATQFNKDVTQFLQGQGVDQATANQYTVIADKMLADKAEANSLAANGLAKADKTVQNEAAESSSDTPKAPAGGNTTTVQMQQQGLQLPQGLPIPKTGNLQMHIGLLNSFAASNDDDTGTNTNANTGGQQDGSQLAGQNAAAAGNTGLAGLLDTPNTQGFSNYMAAANTSSPQAAALTQTVSLQMQQNAITQTNTMTLQLSPADLGTLSIKMKFDKDGGIKAHLTADKPETLAMLKQDSGQLHRSLEQAGFNLDDNALSFDLQGQQQNMGNAQNGGNSANNQNVSNSNQVDGGTQGNITLQAYATVRPGGVNIMV